MNTANHLSQDDLALFALQLLPEDETTAALEHLKNCEACRKEVGEFQGDLALYSMLSEIRTPLPQARGRLLRQVAQAKRVRAEEPALGSGDPPFTRSMGLHGGVLQMQPRDSTSARTRVIAASGWALAACLAVAAGTLFEQRQKLQGALQENQSRVASIQANADSAQTVLSALTDPAALSVTLRQPTAHSAEAPRLPEAHAAYLPDRGALVFLATNLEPLQPYKVYELWLLPATEGQSPIPAGSFRPDAAGRAAILLPAGPKLMTVKGFGVTKEDEHSPHKQPTLPILLMGSSRS